MHMASSVPLCNFHKTLPLHTSFDGSIPLCVQVNPRTTVPQTQNRFRIVSVKCTAKTSTMTSVSSPGKKFDLKSYWEIMTKEVETELEKAVPMRYPEIIHESMRYTVMAPQAKRAPPIMCVAACEAVGGSKSDALPTACAMEMIHAASLIHDDLPCMDNDLFRRGLPTNHSIYGDAMAVLAGDALFPLAFEFLVSNSASKVPSERLLKVIAHIAWTVGSEGMVAGQYVDIVTTGNSKLDPSLVKYIYEQKFGIMAECSAVCGGIIGGATDEQLDRLRKYGRYVGVLYEIVDDLIEEEAILNKQGKVEKKNRTRYPIAYGFGKAREIAESLRDAAKAELSDFDKERAAPLFSFVDYSINRKFDD
eukprot:TRINITY_DN3752_c0_g1_i1.p1 TRINITY_DN3752_c0_g1~~TRINITY_DN3752_c0_g1_i1.p1  ORF type:complete len:363 (+),score=34.68 TRINITY_DN3752_c0_g1_i1:162-1250(+)